MDSGAEGRREGGKLDGKEGIGAKELGSRDERGGRMGGKVEEKGSSGREKGGIAEGDWRGLKSKESLFLRRRRTS